MRAHQHAWFDLPAEQRAAWAGFLRVHADVMAALTEELEEAHRLSLSEYDALLQLSLATEGERRMWELADVVMLSRSGLTRLVERLEKTGLARRRRADDDGRATIATITEAGLQRLEAATPTHLDGVRRRFLEPIGDTGARHLAQAWRALLESSAGEATAASR